MSNAITYLNGLRPAIPMSAEKPCALMSNSELIRHLKSGAILFNGETVSPFENIDFPVFSLVFFPKSNRKVTLV